jgi:hypothetical protein
VLGCDSPIMYGANSLGAGWIGPHFDYSYYSLSLHWGDEFLCAITFSLVESQRYAAWTIEWYHDSPLKEAIVAMRRRYTTPHWEFEVGT